MTVTKHHRRRALPRNMTTIWLALLAAVVVAAGTLLLAGLRPVEYVARISLVAAPAPATIPPPADPANPAGSAVNDRQPETVGSVDFGSVVALQFAALPPLAQSPSVLDAVHAKVPNSPPAGELTDQVTVELVAASALARVSVHADSPVMAKELASAIADELVKSDLLDPVAVLRPIDVQPDVAEIKPDWPMGFGLALVGAVVAAVAVVALRAVLWPAPTQRVTRALTAAGVKHDVAVFSLGDPNVFSRLGVLARTAAVPIRVLPIDADLGKDAEKLSAELANRGFIMAGIYLRTAVPTACICVVDSTKDLAMLSATVSALPHGARLIGVVGK